MFYERAPVEGNYWNYIIDKLTCEIMENKPLGFRM